MTTVYEQRGIPIVRIMEAAAKWISEQITRWQAGAYRTSEVDGGHFESVYGVKHLPARLETSEATDTVTFSTAIECHQGDGSTRTYRITVTVCGDPIESVAA
jgi:hypothetical protein